MQASLRSLLVVGSMYVLNATIGAGTAIRHDWPGAFAGIRSGATAQTDFVRGAGTVLSPPLSMLCVQTGCLVLAARPGSQQRPALRMLVVLGMLSGVGMLGEPIAYRVMRSGTAHGGLRVLVLGNMVLPVLQVVFGRRALASLDATTH